ncbi:MAG: CBS domain-containing protein [Candidatus Peregrinibacteria bacterium]
MEEVLKKPVREVMTKKVISVQKTESIKNLFQRLNEHGILGVPVVDSENKVMGIVTESDLVKHFTTLKTPRGVHVLGSLLYLDDIQDFNKNLKDHCAETVEGLMVSPVVTIESEKPLQDALTLMAEHKINRLPVVDKEGKLVGILTRTDILHQLAQLITV